MKTSSDEARRRGGHARSGPLLRTRAADAAPPLHRAPAATSRRGTRGTPRRIGRLPVVAGAASVVALLVSGAALLLDGDDARPRTTAVDPRPSASAPPSTRLTPALPVEAAPSAAVVAATGAHRTPADARAALEELLTARADQNLALLSSTWAGDRDAAARAGTAVTRTSTGLSAVVTAWRGPEPADRIRSGLDAQSAASRDYAAATAAADEAAADEARARMGQVSRELGGVLDELTDGRIATYVPPQDAAQYRAFVDALAAEDAAAAEEVSAWLRGRLTREGTALAAALVQGGPS